VHQKLSEAAAKSELEADWKRFRGKLVELRTLDGLADSCACQVVWRFCRAPKGYVDTLFFFFVFVFNLKI